MTAKNNTQIQRQNILNNTLAIQKAKENIDITGILYNSTYFFTTQQIDNQKLLVDIGVCIPVQNDIIDWKVV